MASEKFGFKISLSMAWRAAKWLKNALVNVENIETLNNIQYFYITSLNLFNKGVKATWPCLTLDAANMRWASSPEQFIGNLKDASGNIKERVLKIREELDSKYKYVIFDHLMNIICFRPYTINILIYNISSSTILSPIEELINKFQYIINNNIIAENDLINILSNYFKSLPNENDLLSLKKSELYRQGLRFKNYRCGVRSVTTLFGTVSIERMALAACSASDVAKARELGLGATIFPLDEALSLNELPFKMTVPVLTAIALAAALSESLEQAARDLSEIFSIQTNKDLIRSAAILVGSIVCEADLRNAKEAWEGRVSGCQKHPSREKDGVLYLEVSSGAMSPLWDEGATGVKFKDAKLGIVFSTDDILWDIDLDGNIGVKILKKEYVPFIGASEEFTKLLYAAGMRDGGGTYGETVLISDGSNWAADVKNCAFPEARRILNFLSLKKHVIDLTKIIFKNNKNKYVSISKEICDYFENSDSNKAINILSKYINLNYNKYLDDFILFIEENKDYIDYSAYKKSGFYIGVRAIEMDGNSAVQLWMEHGRMRWAFGSGQPMAALRGKALSGLWERGVIRPVSQHYHGEPPSFGQGGELGGIDGN
jgi:hypothetical protein